MQQERGFDGDMMRQNQQDRRPRQQQQQQPPPNQPQRCPRCDSVNTKFCYYNNYSLSQPRYFCKTCRRYWTQGGTLRNVPVGGGCRKGKRAKITAASSSSASSGTENLLRPQSQSQPQALPPQLLQRNFTNIPGTMVPPHPVITPSGAVIAPALRGKQAGNFGTASGFSSMGSYYPGGGGGFLSSLAAITSLNPHPQGFNQPLNQAFTSDGHLNDASNMSLLQGFNFPSFGTQQHHLVHQQPEFYQMGNAAKSTVNPIYPPDHESLLQSSRLQGSSSHHQQQNWHQQSFLNSTAANPTDETLWNMSLDSSTSTTSGNTNNINTTAGSPSLSPNEWPDLSGYGLPP